MTLHTTPIGKTPAAMIEKLDDGRVLVVLFVSTGTHYCSVMQTYTADLSACETVMSVKLPLSNKA